MKNQLKRGKAKLEEEFVDVIYGEIGESVDVEIAGEEKPIEEVITIDSEMELPLESGEILVINEAGDLTEIKEVEEVPVEEEAEEELPVEEDKPIAAKTLGELIDVSTDGEYVVKVVVAGGIITEATVDASQNLIKEALKAKDAEIEKLKEELAKPIGKSVFTEFRPNAKEKNKEELKKMNNLQLTLHRLNLDKE